MVRVDLSDYGYVNARVRGMRAHLLNKDFFKKLVEADSFDSLQGLLEQTVYRREINEAFLTNPENPDYDQALNMNLTASLKTVHDACGGEARRLVDILLSRYDVQNIKAVLRGKQGHARPSEILSTLVPVGGILPETLERMAQETDVAEVITFMKNWKIKYAKPLVEAYPLYKEEDHDLAVLELALDKYHFQDAIDELQGKDTNVKMVWEITTAEIDLRNISTLVRTRGIRMEPEEVERWRIPGGTLDRGQFLYLHNLGDIARIVAEYPDPRYRKILDRALAEYQEIDVVAFDRELEHDLTEKGVAMSNVDVLGIGVIIGFVWSKQNEIVNLRIVLKGKMMEQTPEEIRKDLFFVERRGGGEAAQ